LAVNFNWTDSFGTQKLNHGTWLTAHPQLLSAGFHYRHNSSTAS
jgi:hypothetical protein